MKLHLRQYSMLPVTSSWVRPPIIIQLNKAAGCGGPLPARRFPGPGGWGGLFFECIWFLLASKGWVNITGEAAPSVLLTPHEALRPTHCLVAASGGHK